MKKLIYWLKALKYTRGGSTPPPIGGYLNNYVNGQEKSLMPSILRRMFHYVIVYTGWPL